MKAHDCICHSGDNLQDTAVQELQAQLDNDGLDVEPLYIAQSGRVWRGPHFRYLSQCLTVAAFYGQALAQDWRIVAARRSG